MYFVRESHLTVVTEAWLYDADTLERVQELVEDVDQIFQKSQKSKAAEIFLELVDDEDTCKYYLVDHAAQVCYWLEDVSTSDVDISPSESEAHLRKCSTLRGPTAF